MKKAIVVLMLYITLFQTGVKSQVTQEWVATYSGTGSGYNFPKKSAIDKLGNFIVAGNSDSTNGYDYIVLKYSPGSELLWKQRYNGIENTSDYLTGMVLDDSGNVFVTGASNEGITLGGRNWVTIKYSATGQMMWKRSLNWIANMTDEPFGMNIDKDRNIYVVGYGRVSSLERALVTVKYSSSGDSIWTKGYTSIPNRSNWGYSVVIDDSFNVYSSGYGALPWGNEIVTIKYNLDGKEKWIKRYATNAGDYLRPTFSAIDKENNLVVVGYSYFSNYYDIVTLKYETDRGVLLWNRIYDGSDLDHANSLFVDEHSNILITGYTFVDKDGDYLILKYAPNGDTLLVKNINGEGHSYDQAHSIISDFEDNIYVTGASYSTSFRADYLTIKLDSDGQMIWSKIYRTTRENFAYCLELDNSGSVYVSGEGELTGGNSAITTVKYSQLTGAFTNVFLSSNNFNLKNFPNPFNPTTTINYYLSNSNHVELKIFDILGIEVNSFINKIQNEGSYNVLFDGTNLPSGIYFYSLFIDNDIRETKRMLLIK